MFAGHYGASYALKTVEKGASLGLLFLAVQFIDVLWAIFVILGIEKVQLAPQLASSRLTYNFIPFTHSLLGVLCWSVLVYGVFRFIPASKGARRSAIALVMALGVFSHWLLDFFVHRPDLGLIGNIEKVGLGLYNYPVLAFSLEAVVLLGGLWFYMRSTTGNTFVGKYGMYFFAAFLLFMNAFTYWGPNPPNVQVAAGFNAVFYFAAAAIAIWLDRKRSPRLQPDAVLAKQMSTDRASGKLADGDSGAGGQPCHAEWQRSISLPAGTDPSLRSG